VDSRLGSNLAVRCIRSLVGAGSLLVRDDRTVDDCMNSRVVAAGLVGEGSCRGCSRVVLAVPGSDFVPVADTAPAGPVAVPYSAEVAVDGTSELRACRENSQTAGSGCSHSSARYESAFAAAAVAYASAVAAAVQIGTVGAHNAVAAARLANTLDGAGIQAALRYDAAQFERVTCSGAAGPNGAGRVGHAPGIGLAAGSGSD